SVILVGYFGSPYEAGAFFVALRTAQLLGLFVLASKVVTMPIFSRGAVAGNWRFVQDVSKLSSLICSVFALLGIFVYFAIGETLLGLFGPEYRSAVPILLILSIGYLANAMAGTLEPLLQMSGHEKAYLNLLVCSNGIAVASMLLTARYFG